MGYDLPGTALENRLGAGAPTPPDDDRADAAAFRRAIRNAEIATTRAGEPLVLADGLRMIAYEPDQVAEQLWVMPLALARSYLADLLGQIEIDGDRCPDPEGMATRLIAQSGRGDPAREVLPVGPKGAESDEDQARRSLSSLLRPPLVQLAEVIAIYVVLLMLGAPAGIMTALGACIVSSLFRVFLGRR